MSNKKITKSKEQSMEKERSPTNEGNKDPTKSTTVRLCKDIDVNKLIIGELINTQGGAQPLAFINYWDDIKNSEEKLVLQTGRIKIVSGGIPGHHDKYYATNDKREFIKIPIDREQAACVDLENGLKKLDKYFGSNKFKKNFFGESADNFIYKPLVRTPPKKSAAFANKDKKKETEKTTISYDFCKVKLRVKIEEKERIINTIICKKTDSSKKIIHARTIDDVFNEINFLSTVKLLIYVQKVWVNENPVEGTDKCAYGIGLKATKIEFTPRERSGFNAENVDFVSDDDDDEIDKKYKSNKVSKLDDDADEENETHNVIDEDIKPKKSSKKSVIDEDEEDIKPKKSSNKSVIDEDEEDIKPKKSSKKSTNDDDDNDEEDIKPKKSSKKSTNDDDDEEDIKPKKSSKKSTNDDEEDIKPKKSSKKIAVEDDYEEEEPKSDKKKKAKSKNIVDDDEDLDIKPLSKKKANKDK